MPRNKRAKKRWGEGKDREVKPAPQHSQPRGGKAHKHAAGATLPLAGASHCCKRELTEREAARMHLWYCGAGLELGVLVPTHGFQYLCYILNIQIYKGERGTRDMETEM